MRKVVRWLTHDGRLVLGLVSAALIIIAVVVWLPGYLATHNPDPRLPTEPVVHSTDKPDETRLTSDTAPEVGPDDPHKITIPSIGADGYIQKVGLDQRGGIAAPSNIHVAGWYVHEVRPGEPGLSILSGHIDGRYGPGLFMDLAKLKPGTTFQVTMGDQSSRKFQVVRIASLTVAELGRQIQRQEAGVTHQLNLITADGDYDPKTQQYDKRSLVVSKLVD